MAIYINVDQNLPIKPIANRNSQNVLELSKLISSWLVTYKLEILQLLTMTEEEESSRQLCDLQRDREWPSPLNSNEPLLLNCVKELHFQMKCRRLFLLFYSCSVFIEIWLLGISLLGRNLLQKWPTLEWHDMSQKMASTSKPLRYYDTKTTTNM